MASVRKTRRAVIIDEGWRTGSLAAEICTRIVEQAFWDLDAPIGRVCSEEVPIPYPRHLEEAAIPQVPKIVAAAKARWAKRREEAPLSVVEFRMPSLGADMEAGTLVEWLVKPGDQVKRGDIVAVVETQKGAIEIEIFETGTIEQFLVEVGTEVPVGTPLAVVRTQAEAPVADRGRGGADRCPPLTPPPPTAPAKSIEPRPTPRLRVSPAARRLAEQRGIDLAAVAGERSGGTIVSADIERSPREQGRAKDRLPAGFDLVAMRSAIAAAMARSKREIPHYYLAQPIEMTACEEWLARTNAKRPPSNRLLLGRAPRKGRCARGGKVSRVQWLLSQRQIRTGRLGSCGDGDCHPRRRPYCAGDPRRRSAVPR